MLLSQPLAHMAYTEAGISFWNMLITHRAFLCHFTYLSNTLTNPQTISVRQAEQAHYCFWGRGPNFSVLSRNHPEAEKR